MSQTQGEAEPRLSLDLLAGVREGREQQNGGYLMEHLESAIKEKDSNDEGSERETRPSVDSGSAARISPSEIKVPGHVGKYSPEENNTKAATTTADNVAPQTIPKSPPKLTNNNTTLTQDAEPLSQDLLAGRSSDIQKMEDLKKHEAEFIDRINTLKFKIMNNEYTNVVTACFEELMQQPPPPPHPTDKQSEIDPPSTPTSEKRTGYVFVNVPRTLLPLLRDGVCIAHSSLLNKQPQSKDVEWTDVNFQKAVLITDTTKQLSYGMCDRNMLHEESKLLAQGRQVVSLDEIDFVDTSVKQLVAQCQLAPHEAARQNIIDHVWMRHALLVYPTDPVSRIIQLPNNYFRRCLQEANDAQAQADAKEAEEKLRAKKAREDAENGVEEVVFERRPPQEVIIIDKQQPAAAAVAVKTEPATPRSQKTATATTKATDPSTEEILLKARKRKAKPSNPLFSPKPDIAVKYPCRSAFHSTYSDKKSHASPQCSFCATCHWLETLFNEAEPFCTWKHLPTVHKIRRSKLSAADKKYALGKLVAYENRVRQREAEEAARERELAQAEAQRQAEKQRAKERRRQQEQERLARAQAQAEEDETEYEEEEEEEEEEEAFPTTKPVTKRPRRSLIPEDSDEEEDIEFSFG